MELRETVALCCRMLAMEGLIDYSGHVSAREPETGHFLIHSRLASRLEVTAKDIVPVDIDARPIDPEMEPPVETALHTEVFRVRDDVGSVIHVHSPWAATWSLTSTEFPAACGHAAIFADGVPNLEEARHVRDRERGQRVAAALGEHRALLLRGHGAVVVGATVAEAFAAALHLEENALKLFHASLLGQVRPLPTDQLEDLARGWPTRTVPKIWAYAVSKARHQGLWP